MRDLNELSVTDAVLEQMAETPDERLREVMASLVRHLHGFAREVNLTPQEWLQAIGFLTQVGQACTPARQEFILLSDVLGLSALVNLMHDKTAIEQGTESSLLGPFYRQDAPSLALGDTIAAKARGQPSSSSMAASPIGTASLCRTPRCKSGRRMRRGSTICRKGRARRWTCAATSIAMPPAVIISAP